MLLRFQTDFEQVKCLGLYVVNIVETNVILLTLNRYLARGILILILFSCGQVTLKAKKMLLDTSYRETMQSISRRTCSKFRNLGCKFQLFLKL